MSSSDPLPDVGTYPGRHHDSSNPYMTQFPLRWEAPLPEGLAEARANLATLQAEAATIAGDLAIAGSAGDATRLVELHNRREVLPILVRAAEMAVLTLEITHDRASRQLIGPHLRQLREEQRVARLEAEVARCRERQVGLAVQALDRAGARIDRRVLAAERRKRDSLGVAAPNPISASIQRSLADKGSERTVRHEPVAPRGRPLPSRGLR